MAHDGRRRVKHPRFAGEELLSCVAVHGAAGTTRELRKHGLSAETMRPMHGTNSTAAVPLALTMGDAAGIGPEIIAMAAARDALRDCVVIGDVGVLRRAVRCVSDAPAVAAIESVADLSSVPPRTLAVLEPPGLAQGLAQQPLGKVDA